MALLPYAAAVVGIGISWRPDAFAHQPAWTYYIWLLGGIGALLLTSCTLIGAMAGYFPMRWRLIWFGFSANVADQFVDHAKSAGLGGEVAAAVYSDPEKLFEDVVRGSQNSKLVEFYFRKDNLTISELLPQIAALFAVSGLGLALAWLIGNVIHI